MATRTTNPAATVGANIHCALLGGFRVRVGPRAVADEDWRLLKARTLVKLLALAPGHRLPREQLMDTLWPEADGDAARRSFNYALHIARHALDRAASPARAARDRQAPQGVLRLHDGVLALATPDTLTVDVDLFTAAIARARRTRDPDHYCSALAQYAGELLPDDRYEEWATGPRELLRESFLQALVALAQLQGAGGDHATAIETLRRVLAVAPAHEEAHTLLMRLYDSAGHRALALRQYAQLREALRRELSVEPDPETQRLHGAILAGHTRKAAQDDPRREASPHVVLPTPLTIFIGRERELAELDRLLREDTARARLVTLTGAGGCGKTRLALEAARRVLPHYPDTLWLVELATLDDPERVPALVARALGLREQPGVAPTDLLIQTLRRRSALLILDNCEHLPDPCARLAAALLGACPGLHILATSRVALHVAGELVWRVPALDLPDLSLATTFGAAQLSILAQADAVRLFLDRVALRAPGFRLTTENAAAVAAICRRLDGLPLALELAAGRLPTLTVEELAARLDDALGVLARGDYPTPTRQHTLRATLDWSHALLTPHEAALLRHLAVFAGNWSLAAAEAICGAAGDDAWHAGTDPDGAPGSPRPAPPSFLEVLARLVDQSLITVITVGRATRYALLEIVRQYAREHLVASGEATPLLQRHAAWYLALAEEAGSGLEGAEQARWLRQLAVEHDNLRAALRWAIGGVGGVGGVGGAAPSSSLALRLCTALWRFWESHGYLTEGYDWCLRALALPDVAPATRAGALLGAERLAYWRDNVAAATAHLEEVVALARSHDDQPLLATALTHLGHVALITDRAAARRLYAESLALGQALGDRRIEAGNLSGLGNVAIRLQDYVAARPLLEAALERANGTGLHSEAAFILRCLGRIAFAGGELATAQGYYERCIARWRELGNRSEVAVFQGELAHLLLAQGRHGDATQLLLQSLAVQRELATPQRFPYCLEGLAALAATYGQPIRALRLAAAAAALRSRYGSTIPEIEGDRIARALADARTALGAAASATAWDTGLALTTDDAVTEALTPP